MLELLKENDSSLHEVSDDWDFEADGSPEEVVKQLLAALVEYGGIGLAAPQCGIFKRIFVMGNAMKTVTCINPRIVSLSDDRELNLEGCLSFPDLWLKVKRPDSCVVQYQTETGEVVERELTGLESRIFLHEYDHLIGITFDQRAGDLSLKMAKERRRKELKKAARVAA